VNSRFLAPNDGEPTGAAPVGSRRRGRRARWLASARRGAYAVAGVADPLCRGWRWLPAAVAIGAGPFLVCYLSGVPGHQLASAVALALLCAACARRDAWLTGVAAVALAFVVHNVVVIAVSRADPAGTVALLPDAAEYWQKQITWIRTGCDPEYELAAWVPAHAQLFVAVILFSFTSWGAIPFFQGFYEVDLMNYYNARLILESANQPLAAATGWHVWSLMRGVGYLFITFEAISLSLAWISGKRVSPRKTRRLRWTLGLSFVLADGLLKLALLEPVREQLFWNLK